MKVDENIKDDVEVSQVKNTNSSSSPEIGFRSFIVVAVILVSLLLLSGLLSYVIPQGAYERDQSGMIISDTYVQYGVKGIEVWRVITAPVRVFASDDSLTVIMISIFLLIMSGVFNIIEKTSGIKIVIGRMMNKLADKGAPVVCFCVLIFMLFGSFFGMFEELVTLLPLIITFMITMGFDTMVGLGACLLAACFGFSAAITNPFSVGLAASVIGGDIRDGLWLRIAFFVIIYITLCTFLMRYIKKYEADPKISFTYEKDNIRRSTLDDIKNIDLNSEESVKVFKIYTVFFAAQSLLLLAVAFVRALSDYVIPILSASFLIGGILCGLIVTKRKMETFAYFGRGAVSMLPAVVMIAIASSVKLVMTESGIIDTIMHSIIGLLEGKSPFVTLLLIYLLILVLQIFIGSASAKIMLVLPIVVPICASVGISPTMVILVYCMADGFSDVILPTNPVLLVGLSMANVSYAKWFKWTFKLQLIILVLTVSVLGVATLIGY